MCQEGELYNIVAQTPRLGHERLQLTVLPRILYCDRGVGWDGPRLSRTNGAPLWEASIHVPGKICNWVCLCAWALR